MGIIRQIFYANLDAGSISWNDYQLHKPNASEDKIREQKSALWLYAYKKGYAGV